MSKLLTQLVSQYQAKHNRPPRRIVVTPPTLVFLAYRRTVAPVWAGVPVECRAILPDEAVASGDCLGVDIKDGQVVSFDLQPAVVREHGT